MIFTSRFDQQLKMVSSLNMVLLLVWGLSISFISYGVEINTGLETQLSWDDSLKPGELEPGDKARLIILVPKSKSTTNGIEISFDKCDLEKKLLDTATKPHDRVAVGDIVIFNRRRNESTRSLELQFSGYKPGTAKIPSLILECAGDVVGATKEISFTILQLEQSQPFYYSLPFSGMSSRALIELVLLLVVGSLFIAFLGYRLWKKYLYKVTAKSRIALSPEKEFTSLVDSIDIEAALLSRQFKQVYFRVSDALKRYLAVKSGLSCEEMTSHEIMTSLSSLKVDRSEGFEKLKLIFERLDLVKFTDHTPQLEESRQLLLEIKDWVNRCYL